jgi:hypothetical protein
MDSLTSYSYLIKEDYANDIPNYLRGIFKPGTPYKCIGVIADKLALVDEESSEILEWYSRKCKIYKTNKEKLNG